MHQNCAHVWLLQCSLSKSNSRWENIKTYIGGNVLIYHTLSAHFGLQHKLLSVPFLFRSSGISQPSRFGYSCSQVMLTFMSSFSLNSIKENCTFGAIIEIMPIVIDFFVVISKCDYMITEYILQYIILYQCYLLVKSIFNRVH